MITIDYVNTEANKADVNASQAKREAGNYMKGHISVRGMKIAIENPKGSKRYYGKDGKYNVMKNHYGYFNITKGKDGDAVDVFLGPDIEDFDRVYCIDQNNANGEFDETKVMLGFSSEEEAKKAYLSNYSPDWNGFRDITSVSIKEFKKWLYRGRKQRKPFSEYKNVNINEMKKTVKLNEAELRKMISHTVKSIINEINTNDVMDMLGGYDGQDGPTNDEGESWDEQVYYKALSILRRNEFDGDDVISTLEHVLYDFIDLNKDEKFMNKSPKEAAQIAADEVMNRIDPEYFRDEILALRESYEGTTGQPDSKFWETVCDGAVRKLRELGYPKFDTSNPDAQRKYEKDLFDLNLAVVNEVQNLEGLENVDFDACVDIVVDRVLGKDELSECIKRTVSRKLNEMEEYQPTQKDWDDFGFWASSDEPDLVNDEIGAAHDKEHPEEGYLIDADDEGEGFSRDYMAGVEYANNLIAKSRVPEGLIAELNRKEDEGTISAFELGMLDTLDEG